MNRKQLKAERIICNPKNKCVKCGRGLSKSPHHYFCRDCYVPGLMYSDDMKKKLKGVDLRDMGGQVKPF